MNIGMSADIEKAFLMVGLKEEDRDLFRFLISKNPDDPKDDEVRRMRFARVTFGCVSSMAMLDNVIRYHLSTVADKYPLTVPVITNSLYVDDLSGGENSEDDGFRLYSETKEIFAGAGMNMRKWITSSKSLSRRIKECESETAGATEDSETYVSEQLNREEKSATKVLGVPWDTDSDELFFTLDVLKKYGPGRITKVILLSASASIFDPPGILAPLVFTLKTLFQAVCKESCDWKETLSPECQEVWDKFLKEAKQFSGLRLTRCYGEVFKGVITLVGFGDASEKGYAACVYIVCRQEDGVSSSSLVACKTRVAPLKDTTMPRMELLAAIILMRLICNLLEGLKKVIDIKNIVCLTDAEIVLNWIQRDDRNYNPYVLKRCNKIRAKIPKELWYHVPGSENAADLPSRGCHPKQLEDEKTKRDYLNGPMWLLQEQSSWPITKDLRAKFENDDLELRTSEKGVNNSKCLLSSVKSKPVVHELFDFKTYHDVEKTVRVIAWCLRFVRNCRTKISERKLDDELDASEYESAKGFCIKVEQAKMTSESGFEKRSESLGLYEDDEGFIRCRGRIGKAKIPFVTRFPLILPRDSAFTELIIREAHEKVFHNGVKETLAQVRSAYWIVKGRQLVKKVLKRCFICKILEGLAYPPPGTCDLPEFRVDCGPAFQTIGVDFCGPVYVRDIYNKDGMHKAYIVITTCATSRMLHLELTPNLTTSAYVRSQERFISKRVPKAGCVRQRESLQRT